MPLIGLQSIIVQQDWHSLVSEKGDNDPDSSLLDISCSFNLNETIDAYEEDGKQEAQHETTDGSRILDEIDINDVSISI